MKPHLLAIRAISSTYALKVIRTASIWGGAVAALLLLIIWLLAYNLSDWWWLAAIPVGVLASTGFIIWLVLRLILKRLRPQLSRSQKTATKQFIDKADRLLGNATTPYPVLAMRVVIDTVFKRKNGLITEMTGDSKGLSEEFSKLTNEFK